MLKQSLMETEQHGKEIDVGEVKSGWADSMAKILGSNKPRNKKTLILSRAKKDFEIRNKIERETSSASAPTPTPIPIVRIHPTDDDAEEELSESEAPSKKPKVDAEETVISVKAQRRLEIQQKKQLQEWENINRTKPEPALPSEKIRERELVRIATKGVVQLFNAVNLQQKALKDKLRGAKKSEFQKDKVMHQSKEIFDSSLEKSKGLRGQDYNSDSDEEDVKDLEEVKDEDEDFDPSETTSTITIKTRAGTVSTLSNGKAPTKKRLSIGSNDKKSGKAFKPAFRALHDDFMMGARLKDWDQSDNDDEGAD